MANEIHMGYMDGLNGKSPAWNKRDYEEGYIQGLADREAGFKAPEFFGPLEGPCPFSRGDIVTIPKGTRIRTLEPGKDGYKEAGRTYKVRVYDWNDGNEAYVSYHGQFNRPQAPTIFWPGTGSYWHYVDLNDIPEARTPIVDEERFDLPANDMKGRG